MGYQTAKRALRRYLSATIAKKRWDRWQHRWYAYTYGGPIGRFRKWNQTCPCDMCTGKWEKQPSRLLRRDYRRNG